MAPSINKGNLEKTNFPITYGEHSISKYLFNKAVAKIKNKFNLEQKRAKELIEDIVKMIIQDNKPPANLEREVNSLGCDEWEFLREKSIAEVIEDQEKNKKRRKPCLFLIFWWNLTSK